MALWMVRAGRRGESEETALKNNVVVAGSSRHVDLTHIKSRDELIAHYRQTHPEDKEASIRSWGRQTWAFIHSIKQGDLVVLPLKTTKALAVGEVTGPYKYRPDLPEGARHTRPVNWLRDDIPRAQFPQDVLFSLGAFLTVCRIQRNNAEERMRAAASGQAVVAALKAADPEPEEDLDVEQYGLDQIRAHVGAHFKGHELSGLVSAVLASQGYAVRNSAPGPDGGVDVLAGTGPMGFGEPRLCVQVKSGDSPVEVQVLRELQGVMKSHGASQGLLVSWSGFKKSTLDEAKSKFFEIRLWNADELLGAVLDNYERLPKEIQADIPLKRVWSLVTPEST